MLTAITNLVSRVFLEQKMVHIWLKLNVMEKYTQEQIKA